MQWSKGGNGKSETVNSVDEKRYCSLPQMIPRCVSEAQTHTQSEAHVALQVPLSVLIYSARFASGVAPDAVRTLRLAIPQQLVLGLHRRRGIISNKMPPDGSNKPADLFICVYF